MGIDCTCTLGWTSDKVAELGDPTGLDPNCPVHARPRPRNLTETERLLLAIMYNGPFLRVANWLWKVNGSMAYMTDEELDAMPTVKDGGIRDLLARGFEWLDIRWREWYIKRNRMPNKRWTR